MYMSDVWYTYYSYPLTFLRKKWVDFFYRSLSLSRSLVIREKGEKKRWKKGWKGRRHAISKESCVLFVHMKTNIKRFRNLCNVQCIKWNVTLVRHQSFSLLGLNETWKKQIAFLQATITYFFIMCHMDNSLHKYTLRYLAVNMF